MSESEREHWDERYTNEASPRTEPAAFLVEVADWIPPGSRILDAGGGSGRNAVWLAQRGHHVTVADIAGTGLALAREAAAAADVDIATIQVDLDTEPLPSGPWDVIIDFHFLKRHLFPTYRDALRPGGLLVWSQATERNLERHERPPRPHVIRPGEGWYLLAEFDLLIAREGWSAEGRHEFEALARVPDGGLAH